MAIILQVGLSWKCGTLDMLTWRCTQKRLQILVLRLHGVDTAQCQSIQIKNVTFTYCFPTFSGIPTDISPFFKLSLNSTNLSKLPY